VEFKDVTEDVFTHLIRTNNLARLKFFLELGADAEVCLLDFEINGINGDEFDELEPTPLILTADLDNVPLAHLWLEKGAKVQYICTSARPEAYSAPCMPRGRLRWCSHSWTTTLTPIWMMKSTIDRYTDTPSGTISRPCGRFCSTAQK
jgi:hypothetical protein